jgi:PEP-CTERM motif
MKKTSILITVLLALAAVSSADTINLTSGSGKLYRFGIAPGYTFAFYGSGYGIGIPSASDNFNGDLVNCFECDPYHLGNLILIEGDITNGNASVAGIIRFDAVSFVSSLAPSGILTVKYTANAYLYLFLINPITSGRTGPFVWGDPNQPWYVTAQFTPVVGLPGVYAFAGATLNSSITPVPEPATMMLLGTGILPLLFAVRARLSRIGK